ncbi:MAG: dihydropyrimidinase [Candidatus Promineifilaceae bacterium]|nr:dihydropyrimidinase [Candidatus Promineifilaceae bacterium]
MGTLIRDGLVVTAAETFRADVLMEGETIAAVGLNLPQRDHRLVDASGKLVMPGGIDVHTHLELPVSGTVSSDDFFTGTRAAAFGGTTSFIDFAIQPKGGSLSDGLAAWHEKAATKAAIDYGFHANVTDAHEGIFAEMGTLSEQGVSSIKVLMSYKGTFQVDDTALYRVMQTASDHGLLVLVHCENGDVIAQLIAQLEREGKRAPHFHLDAHPEAAEAEATCRAVHMAGMTGATAYIVHVTCAGAVEQLAIGRAKGYRVMGETCVQYLALDESRLAPLPEDPFAGAKYVCSPPLRTEYDSEVLWDALADNILQVVSTDHCPFYYQGGNDLPLGKELGRDNFARIPNGLPGIEDRMVVTWHLGVNQGRISPNRFVAVMSTDPARIFGMYPQKGSIMPGADADLIIWDPRSSRTLGAAQQHMRTDYSAYEGLEVQGWPEKVFSRGRLIVDGDHWLGEAGHGQYVHRKAHPVLL